MDFKNDNLLAGEVMRGITRMLKESLTKRFCVKIDGRFTNIEYEAGCVWTGSKRVGSGWYAQFDIQVRPVRADGSVVFIPQVAKERGTPAEGEFILSLEENELLPWNISERIMWPKYPHLFHAFAVPDSDWLEICEVEKYKPSTIEYPVRAKAVKLHKGVHVMPVGVMLNATGQHCYMIAVEKDGAFDNFNPTALYPIGTFAQQTIQVGQFDVAGWA